ncbi:MAG: glycosyltransferase family 2 protein [Candidatus Omnitrophota bacterium]
MTILQIIFWILAGVVFYVYFGYPAILMLAAKLNSIEQGVNNSFVPSVTLVIAAYNEEKVMKKKIENTLAIDYPEDKLEIIVASDASIDRTNEIVKEYEKSFPQIMLNAQVQRRGKSAALNHTVLNIAKGEIIIFTDATTFLPPDAVKKLIRHFADKKIGAVCGKIFFNNPGDFSISQNESLYWRYEEFLRKKESAIGVLPFVSGAFYGLRKELYSQAAEGLPDDSVSPLGVYKQGYRVVYEPEAVANEQMPTTKEAEFRIKSRGVIRELGAILSVRELLNPFKYPVLSWVIVSHRLLRWSAGFFLLGIFILSLFLSGSYFYRFIFCSQIAFYTLALSGYVFEKRLFNYRVFSLPFYFCLVNIAAMWGIILCALGKKKPVWEPVR